MEPFKAKYLLTLVFLLPFVFSETCRAQQADSSQTNGGKCPPQQVSDVVYRVLKIRPRKRDTDSLEIKIGKLFLAVIPGTGYTLQSGVTAVVNANISFYTAHPVHTNLSTIFTNVEYSPKYHQLFVPFIFNTWFPANKWNLQGDIRYYKFPSVTYGLGPNTSLDRSDKIDYNYLKLYLSIFKPLSRDLYIGLGQNLDKHWQISSASANTNFKLYNTTSATNSSGLYYCVKFDSRRNSNNPQGGFYCNLALRTNFTFLGSDNNWQSLIVDTRKYIKLRTKRSNIFAFWSYDWFTFGNKVPYLDLPSTSWDTYSNTGRGYTQGRLRGRSFLYLEAEYRFDITCSGLFGGVVFTNAETVNTNENRNYQTILPAAGGGLRIKLNKTSKANFAIDYAVGINGSRGFFFDVSEVF